MTCKSGNIAIKSCHRSQKSIVPMEKILLFYMVMRYNNKELIIVEVTNMSKPSMFSKDYEKHMKRRKIRILLLTIVPIIGLTIFLITDFSSLLNKGISIKSGINNILLNKSKKAVKDNENKTEETTKKTEQVVTPEVTTQPAKISEKEEVSNSEIFIITLSDGQQVSVEYDISGAEKTIKGVKDAKDISYDISPSKKAIIIQSAKNQDMLYLDVNKIFKDVTKKIHVSTRGEQYTKDSQLEKHPNYSWSVSPKFIDEDNVVYISELPWIKEDEVKYLWKVNLKDNAHIQAKPASGKSITFKNITTKGLETVIDGNSVFVNSTGKVIK